MFIQQELRWNNGRNHWVTPETVFTPEKYVVHEVTQQVAAKFVEDNHYLSTWPTSRCAVGLFEVGSVSNGLKDNLVGICNFGVCSNSSAPNYWVKGVQQDTVELNRLILLDSIPFNAESWFIARALKILKVKHPREILIRF